MTAEELITRADELHDQAEEVIKQSHMKELFGQIGSVVFVGSYALNLLYRRDIDVIVVDEQCSKQLALDTTKKLLDSDNFQTVGFADHTNDPSPNGLSGYYWELIIMYKDQKWKFDVWYTAEKKINTLIKTPIIRKKLTENPNSRAEILKLKHQLFDGDKYANNMNSFKIYEHVLGTI